MDNAEQPNSRWYSGCGIYRNVWLTKLNPVHVAPVSYTHLADDYVTKPFNVEILILRMRKLIDLSKKQIGRAHV